MPNLSLKPTAVQLVDQLPELFSSLCAFCPAVTLSQSVYSWEPAPATLPHTQILWFRTDVVKVISEHPIDLQVLLTAPRLVAAGARG